MECLTIGTCEEAIQIKEQILKLIPDENKHRINLRYDKKKSGISDINYIEMSFKESFGSNIKSDFAEIMTECIIEKYEKKLISKIINTNYLYFLHSEKEKILEKSLSKVIQTEGKTSTDYLGERRRHMITSKLKEYLETSNQLIIEGFIQFRLRDYHIELEDVVEEAVEEYLVEREYQEFVKLLKYFVEIQENKIPFLHVITNDKQEYIFLDNLGKDITYECTEDFISEVMTNEINHDDLLISTLILLSPRKIVWHGIGKVTNLELIETIKKIFDDNVAFCNGCAICIPQNNTVRNIE